MNVFAKFYEIPSMILEVKALRTNGRTDNVNTVYPPTNTVCGGYNYQSQSFILLINVKTPTIAGILTFMSMINFMPICVEHSFFL